MSVHRSGFNPTSAFSALAPNLREISKSACSIQLQRAVSDAVQSIGFAYFVFAASVSVEEDTEFYPTMHTLPAKVVDAMVSRGLYRSNPVLARLRQSADAVVVSMNVADPNPVIAEVSALVAPLGIVGAALVPVLSATESLSIIGGYSCSGAPSPEAVSSLRVIGTATSLRMLELCDLPEPPTLTATQASILQWAAAGKSNGDIAEIVGLTRRNCEYHMGEIFRKLGVATRGQAIAALMEGRVQSPMSAASREK
ncbi:DNA-binding transcriptional regulator, CsgD family [Devosia crocina]|uniref:DNA-binding transcriptional regulator, CsgD family n=1 Tax=Devosia crocina TaxID=429728 RepID=A0A1I7NV85_9HYPH|nr:LuxR family transcriptional regulator [Devosia crocina]SFV38585.1 DNA-binding transcriptional regulator, CsgD family [Devosia crocina]